MSIGPNLRDLLHWANWRNEVLGFTFERIVIACNRDLVPTVEVPRTHLELADLLRRKPETYTSRVGTYDIRLSGIGYLLAFYDARQTSTTYGSFSKVWVGRRSFYAAALPRYWNRSPGVDCSSGITCWRLMPTSGCGMVTRWES